MSKEAFTIQVEISATPQAIYDAWLDSDQHTQMTGGTAICSTEVGAHFTAWDAYITGTNKSLRPGKEIIQSWRTVEFADSDEDSELIIQLEASETGTLVTLIHTQIPEGQTQYQQGWIDNYFNPMIKYFS